MFSFSQTSLSQFPKTDTQKTHCMVLFCVSIKTCENLVVAFSWLREKIMAHTAETLLPWKEYCHNSNHSEMVHISRAKMVCKMHTLVYLFDGCNNEFKHHHLLSKNHTF